MDIKGMVHNELGELVRLYKKLHTNPELSGNEINTSKIIADQLDSCGISVTGNFGGYGVVGILENGAGPNIMLRADMDALPITEETDLDYASCATSFDASGNKVGIMHACGHDVHMTTLIGAARILVQRKNSWSGRIMFVAQPAEESMAGARQMIKEGLFEKFGLPDFCIATHVLPGLESGKIAVHTGPAMAGTYQLKITVRGVGGHGAIPQETRDPIVLAARIVTSLQTIVSREFSPLKPAVVTVGSIHGGTRANIIPDQVVMEVTARFFDSEGRNRIYDSINRICRHEALSMDIPEDLLPLVELDSETELPATVNDIRLADSVREAVRTNLGESCLVDVDKLMGSEDFSLFRTAVPDEIPCCLFFTGATSAADMKLKEGGIHIPGLHNSKFCPPPDSTIMAATTTMTASALNLLK